MLREKDIFLYDICSVDEGGQVLSRDNCKIIDMFLEILGTATEMKEMLLEEIIKYELYVILSDIVRQVCSRP